MIKVGDTIINRKEIKITPENYPTAKTYPAGTRFDVIRLGPKSVMQGVKLRLPGGLIGWSVLKDALGEKLYKPAKKCLTPETQFHFHIMPSVIDMKIELPMTLDLTEEQAIQLEDELHDALESVLAKFFNKEE